MADIDYLPASDGTGDAALMHVTSPRTALATIIQVDTVVGVPAFFIGTWGTLLSSGFIDPTTKRDFYGHVNAGTLVIDKMAPGNTDGGNTSSQVVVIKPSTPAQNLVASSIKAGSAFPGLFSNFVEPGGGVWTQTSGLIGQMSAGNVWLSGIRTAIVAIASHTFGTSVDTYVDINPSSGAVTYVAVANGVTEPAVTASSVRVAKVVTSGAAITSIDNTNYTQPIGTTGVFQKAVDPVTRATETFFNYIASGCVWTGDAYGSTLLGSMTAGVVYIAGKRLTVAAIAAHAFVLNQDTYVDFQDNGDGTAKVVYTAVANNAASPAIPNSLADATNIRNAIIVTGATNILNVGSINQGQYNKVLPIVSSIPYTKTDSLGNIICPRDPNRKVIGYRQIIANVANTVVADITGLNFVANIPTNRSVKVSGYVGTGSASAANNGFGMNLVDVTAGVTIASAHNATNASADVVSVNPFTLYTPPASGVRNFKAQGDKGTNAATWNTNSSATNPSYILLELED